MLADMSFVSRVLMIFQACGAKLPVEVIAASTPIIKVEVSSAMEGKSSAFWEAVIGGLKTRTPGFSPLAGGSEGGISSSKGALPLLERGASTGRIYAANLG